MDELKGDGLRKEFISKFPSLSKLLQDVCWNWFSEKLKNERKQTFNKIIDICKKNKDYNLGKSKHFFDIDFEEQSDDVQHEIEGFMWGWQDSNTRIQEQLQIERDKQNG